MITPYLGLLKMHIVTDYSEEEQTFLIDYGKVFIFSPVMSTAFIQIIKMI